MIFDVIMFLGKWIIKIIKKIVWLIAFIFKLILNIFGSIYNLFIFIFFPSKKRGEIKKYTWKKLIN